MFMRRILPSLIVLVLLCGCSRLAAGEYQVITEHVESGPSQETAGRIYEVHTYSGLKRAIQDLVNSNAEDGVVRAIEYTGIIRDDISKACLEVARSSPMGSYAVDYMTHTLTRILTYDEISLHIQYKLSPEEVSAVRSVSSLNDFYARIDEGLDSGTEFIALQIVTLALNDRSIKNYIANYYRQHPDTLLSQPDVSVSFYPAEEYVQKIITLNLDYHITADDRIEMLHRLQDEAKSLVRKISPAHPDGAALFCCMAVIDKLDRISSRGRTAYDVLINQTGSSEGCAMAYELLCSLCGIPCQVVSGRLNSETHYWNLIYLDQAYYHVDCSACIGHELTDGFLKQDSDLWGSYWWESELYPAAQGELNAETLMEEYMSIKPLPTPDAHFEFNE